MSIQYVTVLYRLRLHCRTLLFFSLDGLWLAFWLGGLLVELVKERGYRESMEQYVRVRGLKTLTIQGELCAPGIQQNRLKLIRPEWYVFTIREDGKRVGLKRMLTVCNALNMTPVPIEEVDTDLPSKYPTVEALLARADGDYPNGGKKEGIVIRPTEPVFCPLISAPLSMKVVSNKYLLKNDT